jgi:hypothetical protein
MDPPPSAPLDADQNRRRRAAQPNEGLADPSIIGMKRERVLSPPPFLSRRLHVR